MPLTACSNALGLSDSLICRLLGFCHQPLVGSLARHSVQMARHNPSDVRPALYSFTMRTKRMTRTTRPTDLWQQGAGRKGTHMRDPCEHNMDPLNMSASFHYWTPPKQRSTASEARTRPVLRFVHPAPGPECRWHIVRNTTREECEHGNKIL